MLGKVIVTGINMQMGPMMGETEEIYNVTVQPILEEGTQWGRDMSFSFAIKDPTTYIVGDEYNMSLDAIAV